MKLNLPKAPSDYPFHVQPVIRMSDMAGGMHVSNHTLVSYLTEAQLQLVARLGFPKFYVEGVMPINSGLEISYLSETGYGDVLDIGVSIECFEKQQYQLVFHVANTNTGRSVCQARMYMSFIDVEQHCRADVPQVFIDAWQDFVCN